jgi:hypothetical protein
MRPATKHITTPDDQPEGQHQEQNHTPTQDPQQKLFPILTR